MKYIHGVWYYNGKAYTSFRAALESIRFPPGPQYSTLGR